MRMNSHACFLKLPRESIITIINFISKSKHLKIEGESPPVTGQIAQARGRNLI